MKGAVLLAAAAGLVGSALAYSPHRHGHDHLHRRHNNKDGLPCGCRVEVITITGEGVLVQPETTRMTTTLRSTSTSYTTVTVSAPEPAKPSEHAPSQSVSTFPTPGTYTIPATTITVNKTTTVCGATTTNLIPGPNTYGGHIVTATGPTTIVTPIAVVKSSGSTVVSVIDKTSYVCPSAGTYTIAPTTTSVSSSTMIVYPVPEIFNPGTYIAPAATVTVTKTNFVYLCPKPTSSASPAPSKAPEPIPAPPQAPSKAPEPAPVPAPSSKAPEAPAPPAPSSKAPEPAPQPKPSQSEPPKTEPSKNPSSPPPTLGGGKTLGLTYTQYTSGGQCKTAEEVKSDMVIIKGKGFDTVRLYGVDCNGLQNVGSACKEIGLKLIVGIFIDGKGIEGAKPQVNDMINWGKSGYWSIVSLIVVGNEVIFNGHADGPSLANFISSCKSSFKAAGYSGIVTTTEPINIWEANAGSLCGPVDVVGGNLHPFFNAAITASEAGPFVKKQLDLLSGLCNGKRAVNLETGWPHGGEPNGKAVPGPSEQMTAVKSLVQAVGPDSVFFAYADDKWKGLGKFGVEQYWGLLGCF